MPSKEETARGEGCESTDSSTDVIVELNPLSIPVKTIDLVQINDKQDSGIDGRPCRNPSMLYFTYTLDKNSTSPSSPKDLQTEPVAVQSLETSLVCDVREKEKRGRISKKAIELQRAQRRQHINDVVSILQTIDCSRVYIHVD